MGKVLGSRIFEMHAIFVAAVFLCVVQMIIRLARYVPDLLCLLYCGMLGIFITISITVIFHGNFKCYLTVMSYRDILKWQHTDTEQTCVPSNGNGVNTI